MQFANSANSAGKLWMWLSLGLLYLMETCYLGWSLDSLRSSSAKVGSQTVNNYFLSSFLNYFLQTGNNYFLLWGVCVNNPYAILGPNLLFFCNKILPPVPDIQYSCKAMWGQPCGKGTQAWSNPFLSEFCVLDLEVLFVLKLSSFSTDIWFSASLNKLCNRSFISRMQWSTTD